MTNVLQTQKNSDLQAKKCHTPYLFSKHVLSVGQWLTRLVSSTLRWCWHKLSPVLVTVLKYAASRLAARSVQFSHFLLGYPRYFHLLTLAGFFYVSVWLIFSSVEPAFLANWPWPDGYLLIQVLLFAANYLVGTFIFQSRRAGAWLAASVATVLFFRLSHFLFTLPLVVTLLAASFAWWIYFIGWPNWSVRRSSAVV